MVFRFTKNFSSFFYFRFFVLLLFISLSLLYWSPIPLEYSSKHTTIFLSKAINSYVWFSSFFFLCIFWSIFGTYNVEGKYYVFNVFWDCRQHDHPFKWMDWKMSFLLAKKPTKFNVKDIDFSFFVCLLVLLLLLLLMIIIIFGFCDSQSAKAFNIFMLRCMIEKARI